MKRLLLLFLGLILAASTLSCGYTTRSALPGNYRTIHIEPFENRIDFASESRRNIYLPLLEVDVRNAIIDRFLFDGNLNIAEEHKADLVLSGELLSYNRGGLRFTSGDDVEEYRVRIMVSLILREADTGEIVWQEDRFAGEGTYFVSGPLASSEQTAVDEAINDLARRVVERTIENW